MKGIWRRLKPTEIIEPWDVWANHEFTDLGTVNLATANVHDRTLVFIHQKHVGQMVDETDYSVWRLEGVESPQSEPIDKDRKIEMEL